MPQLWTKSNPVVIGTYVQSESGGSEGSLRVLVGGPSWKELMRDIMLRFKSSDAVAFNLGMLKTML